MSKYDPLRRYLLKSGVDSLKLSFREVEEIIGDVLPESAYVYREWWSNDKYHTQARNGWLAAGYIVSYVDLEAKYVVFSKSKSYDDVDIEGIDWEDFIEHTSSEVRRSMGAKRFEKFARDVMFRYFCKRLNRFRKPGWPKEFDLVSEDLTIVGDAKYYTMVRGKSIPPAKFATIAEHVWFLEKIDADIKFLVFGNDIRVPLEWLKRYGDYVVGVRFYFIDEEGNVKRLK